MLATQLNATKPTRILYSMVRVTDLEQSIEFYQQVLGMKEVRRENFTQGRFTLVFMGYGDNADTTLELTYNWDPQEYQHGNGYGHLALAVNSLDGFFSRLDRSKVTVIREPGPMSFANDENGHRESIAFISDPDGYKIELIELNEK
ncbi:MAG: VOC family protein [Kangiellaceae bacterium]|nr:VOC family protein [Kangiellaceae bacterium]